MDDNKMKFIMENEPLKKAYIAKLLEELRLETLQIKLKRQDEESFRATESKKEETMKKLELKPDTF